MYARGVELHMDGRHRKRDRLGIVHFKPLFPTSGGPRGAIQGFSADSRRRLAWTLANAPVDFAVHITLTYHARVDETDGDQVAARNRALVERAKADLNRLLACLRAEIGAYCWIQEFQKRGAIHYNHLLSEPREMERRERRVPTPMLKAKVSSCLLCDWYRRHVEPASSRRPRGRGVPRRRLSARCEPA